MLVEGMSCGHCEKAVKSALSEIAGVSSVNVDLATKKVAVEEAGYDVVEINQIGDNMNEGKKKAANKLKTARGQIDGIIKMIEDDRYCVDVSTQMLSVIGLLRKANIDVLNSHIRSCVSTAILESEEQGEQKIEEIINIIDKYIK